MKIKKTGIKKIILFLVLLIMPGGIFVIIGYLLWKSKEKKENE